METQQVTRPTYTIGLNGENAMSDRANPGEEAMGQGDVVIYQSDDGETKIDVRFVGDTVWLTQA